MNDLIKKLNILNDISNYEIEFGILIEDEVKIVNITLHDIDDTEKNIDMSIGDIMYFTELGTVTIPALHILRDTLNWVNENINPFIEDIIDNVIENNYDKSYIRDCFNLFAIKIENKAREILKNKIQSLSTVNTILNIDNNNNKYLYDINKLENYIKCRIYKKI